MFSRYEEYSLFQGIERTSNSSDYTNYAKVYIRADTKRTDVKRKYQKVMEFYADASSLLIALYEILIIILNYINNFWAEQALSKKIFFFKDLEESGLNVKKRATQIKDLLEITKAVSPLSQISEQKSTKENIGENLDNEKKNDIEIIDDLLTDEIKIYNTKKRKNISPNKNILKKEKGNEKKTILGKKGRKVKENEKIKLSRNVKDNSIDNNERGSNHYRRRDSRSSFNFIHNMNMKNQSKYQQNNNYNESKIETSEEDENTKGELSPDKITYDFNICEVIGSTICKCCQSKELKIKYNLNEKANSILYSKLDIVFM